MEFGKLNDVSGVDFSLPAILEPTRARLASYPKTANPALYIGCTGWGMKEWLGSYYPKTAKSADFLKYYAQQFNTVELNATHYQTPTEELVKEWAKKADFEDFSFAPKMLQAVSHADSLRLGLPTMRFFCDSLRPLGKRLGLVFTQLPERFGLGQLEELEAYLAHFPADIAHAVEVRHQSFFNKKDPKTELYFELLEKYQTGTVITDVAGRRDVAHMRLTNPTAVVRFVGNENERSDRQRLDRWLEIISEWLDEGLQRLYFFCHQPNNVKAAELAVYLCEIIQQRSAWKVRKPLRLGDNSEQMSLF